MNEDDSLFGAFMQELGSFYAAADPSVCFVGSPVSVAGGQVSLEHGTLPDTQDRASCRWQPYWGPTAATPAGQRTVDGGPTLQDLIGRAELYGGCGGGGGGDVASGGSITDNGARMHARRRRKRVITRTQRKAANVRERRRMFEMNDAFDGLRTAVPKFAYEKRLSRIDTLRLAGDYISFMMQLLKTTSTTTTTTATSSDSMTSFDSMTSPRESMTSSHPSSPSSISTLASVFAMTRDCCRRSGDEGEEDIAEKIRSACHVTLDDDVKSPLQLGRLAGVCNTIQPVLAGYRN